MLLHSYLCASQEFHINLEKDDLRKKIRWCNNKPASKLLKNFAVYLLFYMLKPVFQIK